MSKSKSKTMLSLHNYPSNNLKYCEKCQRPIATTWANWKYKLCGKCSLESIKNFKKQNNIGDFKGWLRREWVESDYSSGRRWIKDRCEICSYTDALDVHRIVPKNEGGEYTIDNVITLCPNCHALITRKKKELKEEVIGTNRIFKLANKETRDYSGIK